MNNQSDLYQMESRPRPSIWSHLYQGINYMIPLAIASGLMLAIVNAFAFQVDPQHPDQIIWQMGDGRAGELLERINLAGRSGFTLMIPVLSAGIAYSIAGYSGIGPALVGGYLINDPVFLNAKTGAGFFGAIVIGYSVGFVCLKFSQWRGPKNIQAIIQLMVIPFLVTLLASLFIYYMVGKPLAQLMDSLYQWINQLTQQYSSAPLVYGAILGGMIGSDLGGPINKTAGLVASAIFIDTMNQGGPLMANGIPQAATGAAIAVAPLGSAITAYLLNEYLSEDLESLGKSNLISGIFGISEGAMPFIIKYPRLIIVNILTSAFAGGAVAFKHIHFYGGVGSPLGAFIGYLTGVPAVRLWWMGIIFAAALINGLISTLVIREEISRAKV